MTTDSKLSGDQHFRRDFRRAFSGAKIEAEALASLKATDPVVLANMRADLVMNHLRKAFELATKAKLFPGDRSQVEASDLLDDIGTWFAFTLLNELGDDAAQAVMEDLAGAVDGGL